MRGRVIAAFGVLAAVGIAGACALDIPDVIVEGGVDATSDSPADVNVPDVPIPQCDGSCAPTGFTPVLFALDRSTACPSGMQTLDLAVDPGAAPPSACTCDCTVTSQPECVPATVTHDIEQFGSLDGGLSCNGSGTPFTLDGGCNIVPDGGAVAIHIAWDWYPYPPVEAGTCTSNAIVNSSGVPSSAGRLCVDPTCAGTCANQGNLAACVYAQGNVPCPSAYSKAHHAGTVSVSCPACQGCTVTSDGGCEGTIAFYADFGCAVKITTANMDAGCAATGANGQTAPSMRYTPVVAGVACNPGTSGNGTVSLGGEVTVCCP